MMKAFNTTAEMIAAYTADHNSRCDHNDKHFTSAEIETHHLSTIMRMSMQIKYGITISAKQTNIIRGFGYVAA